MYGQSLGTGSKNRTSAAKAVKISLFHGTAKAVPFV